MSKGSQVVCDKAMVLDVATRGLKWIEEYRHRERESFITSAMEQRKWFGFGGNYTRDEAISNLKSDTWNQFHWVNVSYQDVEDLFGRLIGAIEVCSNGKNILLSVKDAHVISKWRDE